MSIQDEIKKQTVEAARAKDQVKLDALRMTNSAIHYKEIEKKGKLEEREVSQILMTLCKQRRESIEQFQKGGRTDLAAKETRELEILQGFLPKQISREEVEKIVKRVIGETKAAGPADMGKVIKAVMKEVAGQADGSLISGVVKDLLK